MVELERHIEAQQPERSLLMSYCSSLAFFEYALLPRLQSSGDGAVTVFVDAADYENSFSDAIEGAGVDYALEPVHLPRRFHPKLYLFTKADTATLFVASANLTKSGFRANAEVVDQLVVSPKATADALALLQYADLLELLCNRYAHFSKSAQHELGRAASFIRRVTQGAKNGPGGPLFLHNAVTPLLQQIIELIPAKDITEVALISPYFDPGCMAIRELAAAYPIARFRIIKADSDGNLNGAALKRIKQRLTIENFVGCGKARRNLHGKVAIFKSPATSWVVTGSANITSAAWLRAAFSQHAGNLEGVVLRERPDLADQLLRDLRTRKLALDTLHYSPVSTAQDGAGPELLLYDAVLRRGLLTITGVLRNSKTAKCTASIYVEQNGIRTDFPAELIQREEELTVTAKMSDRPTASLETAGVVTVRLRLAGGGSILARRWISRPDLLILPASERRARGSVRSMCQQLFANEEGQIVLDAIGKFISDIGELTLESRSTTNGTAGPQQARSRTEDHDNSEMSLNGFLTDDLEIRSFGRSHRQHAATMMEQLASALRRIIVEPTDQMLDDEATDLVRPSEADKTTLQIQEEQKDKREEASALAGAVLADVVQAVDRAHQAPVRPAAIPFVINVPEAIGAFGLFQLRVGAVLEQSVSNEFSYHLRRMLVAALSIDGVLCGGSFGWLIRAWCQADTHDQLIQCVLNDDYWAQLRAFAAAGVLLGDIGLTEDAQMQSVMAGVALVTSVPLPRDKDNEAKVSALLDHLAGASSGKLGRKSLDAVLSPFTYQNAPALRNAPRWVYLHRLHTAATTDAAAVAASQLEFVAPTLMAQYKRMRSRYSDPIAYLRPGRDGAEIAYCSYDNLRLTNTLLNRIRTNDSDFAVCDSCHRILVPYDFADSRAMAVLEHFFPALSQESS